MVVGARKDQYALVIIGRIGGRVPDNVPLVVGGPPGVIAHRPVICIGLATGVVHHTTLGVVNGVITDGGSITILDNHAIADIVNGIAGDADARSGPRANRDTYTIPGAHDARLGRHIDRIARECNPRQACATRNADQAVWQLSES